MARLPRLTLAGYPHLILQRGNNRQPIFSAPADREFLLEALYQGSRKFGTAIHGYALLDNQFHLLATPQDDQGLPRMMQALGRSYVRYFNTAHTRSGTLWEGRYRSTLIQPDRHLIECMVYMDLQAAGAGLSADASSYAWSSHDHYAGLRTDKLISPHALWWMLGNTPFEREAAYAETVRAGMPVQLQEEFTRAALGGWAMGDDSFRAELQRQTDRRVAKARPGRPKSSASIS